MPGGLRKGSTNASLASEVLRLTVLKGTVEFTPLECSEQGAEVMFTMYMPASVFLLDPKAIKHSKNIVLVSATMKHLGSISRSGISF